MGKAELRAQTCVPVGLPGTSRRATWSTGCWHTCRAGRVCAATSPCPASHQPARSSRPCSPAAIRSSCRWPAPMERLEWVAALESRPWDAWGLPGRPPCPAPRVDVSGVDIVVVPALAITPRGQRLGQGGGYYDRFLPRAPACPHAGPGVVRRGPPRRVRATPRRHRGRVGDRRWLTRPRTCSSPTN